MTKAAHPKRIAQRKLATAIASFIIYKTFSVKTPKRS
jgi:hypothetical protein